MIAINRKISKIIIAITLIIAILLSSCGSSSGNADKPVKTDTDLVIRGASEYKIILPVVAEASEKSAARELQIFFEEATGVQLPIDTDEGKTAGGKYFSIGNTAFVPQDVKNSLSGLKSSGYVIKTSGETVYLIGPSANGTLYSVYGYLSREFGFEYYFTDMYSLNRGIGDLKLTKYDVKVNPDIDIMTTPSVGFIQNNSTNKLRFNAVITSECFIPANGTTQTHNLFRIMPNPEYDDELFNEHPKWYAKSAKPLTGCFTAQGDPVEYEAMQEYFLNVIKDGMKISSANIFQISQPDNAGFCTCEACLASSVENGGDSGTMVKFCNDLCARVYRWFDTEEGKPYKRDFKLVFLAYQAILNAPSVDSVRCDENVGIYQAFDGFKSSYGLHEDDGNESLYQTVMEWSKKTNVFLFWIYDVNFNMYFYPYDTSAYKQDFYRMMKEVGTVIFNDLSQHQNTESATAWNNVKSYVTTKLRWDVNANIELLVKDFFKNCYKDAWEIMYNVYSECKAHWAVLKYKAEEDPTFDNSSDLRGIFGALNQTKFWSLTMLESWVSQFKDAIKAIEPLKQTDEVTYGKVYKMICAELISPMSIIIELYRTEFSAQDFSALVEEFKAYVEDSGVGYYADGMSSPISEFYASLGI